MKVLLELSFLLAALCASHARAAEVRNEVELVDQARQRKIPLVVQLPQNDCRARGECQVAFLSPGYGLGPSDYKFLSDHLSRSGYLVVSIQSILPSDPPLPNTGNVVADRTPMWTTGADNMRFVKSQLIRQYQGYDWGDLLLIGHSNGGDMSALALSQTPALARRLVTLDNRRYPLPRNKAIGVLSIRGSDFPADQGVIPSEKEAVSLGQCIVKVPEARHDDMTDSGPVWLKDRIIALLGSFISANRCDA